MLILQKTVSRRPACLVEVDGCVFGDGQLFIEPETEVTDE